MTTIHPLALAEAIADHAVELIDRAPAVGISARSHSRRALCAPERTASGSPGLHARSAKLDPALSHFAAADAGQFGGWNADRGQVLQPVVVQGGMGLWESQGFPVVQAKRHPASALVDWLGAIIRPILCNAIGMTRPAPNERTPRVAK